MHIVFVEPEIPPNTGTTARLCAATNTTFHLVGPLGFSLEDRYLKRAGLDYWPYVDLHVYDDWRHFRSANRTDRMHFFSARAKRSHLSARYTSGDHLIFGCETKGLPPALAAAHRDETYVIPLASPHV